MNNNKTKIILEDQQHDFIYQKNKSNLNIIFNRIAFIFFIFFIIFFIYSIHLIHLGSRKANTQLNKKIHISTNKLNRANFVDRNGNYISRSVNSIDIGISPSKIIDKKKLIINLKYIFPEKDYVEIKKK